MRKFKFTVNLVLGVFLSVSGAESVAKIKKSEPRKPAQNRICPNSLGTELPFLNDIDLKIVSYDPETLTYKVQSAYSPDEGENDSTLEALALGISDIRFAMVEILKDPEKIVGEVYRTKREIPGLSDDELEARRGCHRR